MMMSFFPILFALRFYLQPYLIGRAIVVVANFAWKKRSQQKPKHAAEKKKLASVSKIFVGKQISHSSQDETNFIETIFRQPLFFAAGALVIFVGALKIQYILPMFGTTIIFSDFFPIVNLFSFVALVINLISLRLPSKKALLSSLFPATLILALSVITITIWQFKTPWPLNWDLYEHQTLVNRILSGHFDFFTSHISDTFGFNSYPPFFHSIMSVSQSGFQLSAAQILEYWNAVSFLHLLVISGASFAFAYAVTRNRWIAAISCVIGTLTFESTIAFTNLFLLPQTLTAAVFIFAYSHLLLQRKNKEVVSLWWLITLAPTLVLSHYVVGGLAALIYLVSYVYIRFEKWFNKVFTRFPILELGVILMIGGVFASRMIDLSFLNKGEAASYTFSFAEKIEFMRRAYGWELLIFVPLGIFTALRKQTSRMVLTLLVSLGFIAILLSEFPYVFKFYVIGRFFTHLLVALGIWSILGKVKSGTLKALAIVVLIGTLCALLVMNTVFWKQNLTYHGETRHVGNDEVAAADFLKNNYHAEEALLISDPATQYILEALSGINSAGGSFATQENRQLTAQIKPSMTQSELLEILQHIQDPVQGNHQKVLIAFSGRFFLWQAATPQQQSSFDFNIWTPYDLDLHQEQAIQDFARRQPSREVFSSPSLVILEIDTPNLLRVD